MTKMRLIKFRPQTRYKDGENMCSSASTAICLYMVLRDSTCFQMIQPKLDELMRFALGLHNKVFDATNTSHSRHVTVAEVMTHNSIVDFLQDKKQHNPVIDISECGGCVHNTPSEMKSPLCMNALEFTEMIRMDTFHSKRACTYTSKGHTTAFGKSGDQWWFFDSLTGVFAHDTDLDTVTFHLVPPNNGTWPPPNIPTQYSSVIFTRV